MSSNGPAITRNDSKSPVPIRPFSPSINTPTVHNRTSLDSERSSTYSPPVTANGHAHAPVDEEGLDTIEKLKRDLERERQEKEDLTTQHRNLLAKLTTMRTSLGNKLKQDAVCLYHVSILSVYLTNLA